MTVTVNVIQKLDNQFVKVKAEGDKVPTRYFKVPENKVDEFSSEYNKNINDNKLLGNVLLFTGVIGACAITGLFTKNITNKFVQYGIGIVSGLVGAAGALIGGTKISSKKESRLLNQLQAEEVFHKKKEMPI